MSLMILTINCHIKPCAPLDYPGKQKNIVMQVKRPIKGHFSLSEASTDSV